MKETDYKAFCDKWVRAWTGNRPEQLLSFYATDAYYQDPGQPQGLRGHSEIRPYFEKLLAANPDWVWKLVELIPNEKGFVVKWEAEIPILDATVSVTGVDIVEIQDNKITRNEVYFDPSALKGSPAAATK